MKWSILFPFIFLFFLLFNPCYSAGAANDLDYVTFEGTAIDIGGQAIAGAQVTVHHITNNNERLTITNNEGRYRFTKLAPGIYDLRIEAAGYQCVRYQGINVVAGTTVRRDFQLQPAAIEASVTIDATVDSLQIDTSRTVIGGTITTQKIDNLPLETRNPLDLIYTLPGIAAPALSDRDLAEGESRDNFRRPPDEAGIFSLTGGTPYSNNITIEGLDNNDDRAARERFIPSADAVEEVQVISNQFSAEYGRASGGRVNLRLRAGANRFHGRAFYYFRDESLNANSYTRNSDPARGSRLPYQNHNPGVSFGGPIRKNSVFFFGAYEYDNVYDHADITALLPVDANPSFVLPRPNGANLGSTAFDRNGRPVVVNGGAAVGLYDVRVTTPRVAHTAQSRIDFKIGGKQDLFALLTISRNNDERGFPGGRRTLDTLRQVSRNNESIAIGNNTVFSNYLINTARFQYSSLTPADAPSLANPVVIINIDDPRDVIGNPNANPLSRSGNLTAGSSTISGVDRREDRYQIQETVNYIRGPHTLRLGIDAQIIRSRFADLFDATGTFNFATPADFLANRPSRYQHRFNTESELGNTYTGLFVQEDWRVGQNLTFSAGLRWDYESILGDHNNIGPRFSFALDPLRDGKTVIRAGYGIFYNRALLRTLDDFVLTSNTFQIDTNNEAAKQLLVDLKFPQVLVPGDSRINRYGVPESGFLRRLSKGFRIPESYQASLGFERELSRNTKIEVNYVFNRGLHLWREVNVNAPILPTGYQSFADYLLSRDFDNRRDPVTGQRPITNTGNADFVRFDLSQVSSRTIRESNKTIVLFGLNNQSTSNQTSGINAALAVVRPFRPNPDITQVEELQSRGNSFYHGVSFEVQSRLRKNGFVRASYTLSKLIDDGVVNTSSPLVVGDFRNERALSLLDVRHRVAISGSYLFPALLGRISLSGTFGFASSRPFNLGINGNDRNLDDVDNDRPNFNGDLSTIKWRRPSEPIDQKLLEAFSLPAYGRTGNLPRNAGRGPNSYLLNLRLSREFRIDERRKLQFQIEAFNPLNSTVLSFGAEFVDFNPSSLSNFLVPRRAVKPRTLRVGVRVDF